MHIQPHSQAQLVGSWKASPAFFENGKECPDSGKKAPVHLWVKFSIQNVVLKYLGEKTP